MYNDCILPDGFSIHTLFFPEQEGCPPEYAPGEAGGGARNQGGGLRQSQGGRKYFPFHAFSIFKNLINSLPLYSKLVYERMKRISITTYFYCFI